ncbi:hypothetical protein [Lactococcus lactis]|uniref:hypothetical protein n=1 Tax=Lactococcus lactis TaxID=1358 RepID=UPI0022E9419E|nr:hypothetical protein [Lactococcus lactis]MDA2897930.1 hypothetical protein [Lactococcus lactis]
MKKFFIGILSLLILFTITACSKTNSSSKDSSQSTTKLIKESSKETQTKQASSTELSSSSKQQSSENIYYVQLKKAWLDELDYINSISDPHIKQAVQSPESAANFKSNELVNQHPEDTSVINENLKKVLSCQ